MDSRVAKVTVLLLLAQPLLGCGILGSKNDPGNALNLSLMTGCLNEITPNIQAYAVGRVSPDEWRQGWNCTIQLLNLFQQFTGSSASFKPEEILSFVRLELVTNSDVSLDFVKAAFQLKASILGGSDTLVTNTELSSFVKILAVLRDETTALIPYFAYRGGAPSPSHMLELSRAIDASTQRISQAFEGMGSIPFTGNALRTLVSEAVKTFKLPIPPNTPDILLAIKAVLFAGDADTIEPEGWIRLIQTTGTIGGPLIAAASVKPKELTEPNEMGEFIYQLVLQAKPVVDRAISLNGGAISLTLIDNLLDSFTNGLQLGSTVVHSAAAKATMATLFSKIFPSAQPASFDRQAENAIMSFYDRWRRGQTHLETIFRDFALNTDSIDTSLFIRAATQYMADLDTTGQADVERLINLASHYHPLFYGTDTEISFIPTLQHSMGNLSKLHLFNLASELLLQSYASDQSLFKLSSADWAAMVGDITALGEDLQAIDPAVDQEFGPGSFAARRLREIDMFTLSSSGTTFIDIDELTYYIATIASLSATMNRVKADINVLCSNGTGIDGMGWLWMDPVCFRREFYARASASYWTREPFLQQQYAALTSAAQAEFQLDTDKAARLHQTNDHYPMGGYDASGFMLVTLLQENFFERFDTNQDGWLNTAEAIASAPPTERFTANRAGLSLTNTSILEAIQTYALNSGKVPCNDIGGVLALGAWALERPFWNLHAVRPMAYKTAYIFSDMSNSTAGCSP